MNYAVSVSYKIQAAWYVIHRRLKKINNEMVFTKYEVQVNKSIGMIPVESKCGV